MNKFESYSGFLRWFMALLLVALAAGCGGGSGKDPILGAGGAGIGPGAGGAIPPGAVAPGPATCAAAVGNPLIPTVNSSNPTNGALNVTTSTTGVAGGGKLITATFSLPMTSATITAAGTFTVTGPGVTPVTGTVTYAAAPSSTATFTTAAALPVNTLFTAIITTAAQSATGTPLACSYAWTFTTGASAATGQAPINLGTASTYGIFVVSDASLTLTGPSTLINGDIGFMANGAGSCITFPGPANITCANQVPPVNGVVHNGDGAAAQAQIDFNAAYVDGAGRVTNPCAIVNADMSSAQGACAGFSPITPGPVYGPGLYNKATPLGFSGTITLDAGGNPDAVFIFQGTQLTTAPSSTVVLTGLAQAKNVFWIIGTSAILGTSSTFRGTIIIGGGGAAAITVGGGTAGLPTVVEGRMFSGAAATVGTFATITVPAP